MNKFKKEIYQKLDKLETTSRSFTRIISNLVDKITKLENDLVEEKLSKNNTNQEFVYINHNLEHSPTIGEQYKDNIYEYVDNAYKFNVEYIKAINFLTDFKPSYIDSSKLRDEMLNKKVVDLKRCEIEDLAPKEKSIVGYSIYTSQETQVAKVLNQPFDFDPITIIRVAKYIQEVQDLDYKVSKYAEFEDYEEE